MRTLLIMALALLGGCFADLPPHTQLLYNVPAFEQLHVEYNLNKIAWAKMDNDAKKACTLNNEFVRAVQALCRQVEYLGCDTWLALKQADCSTLPDSADAPH